MAKKAKKMEIHKLAVIFFDDLPGAKGFHENNTFDKVSYGDAEYTLVHPGQLLDELCWMDDEYGNDEHVLVRALNSVPKNVLVALRG